MKPQQRELTNTSLLNMYAALGFVLLLTAIVLKDECRNYGLYYIM